MTSRMPELGKSGSVGASEKQSPEATRPDFLPSGGGERPVDLTHVAIDDAPEHEADGILRRAEGGGSEQFGDGARVVAHEVRS